MDTLQAFVWSLTILQLVALLCEQKRTQKVVYDDHVDV